MPRLTEVLQVSLQYLHLHMRYNNPIDRGEPGLLPQEVEDSPDIDLPEPSREASWDPDQLLNPENPLEGAADEEVADADLENGLSDKARNPVFLYLPELGSIPLLTREQEITLAQKS